jgi:hypothetical protein
MLQQKRPQFSAKISNPRMPLMSELKELFLIAYKGRGQVKAADAAQ